MNHVVDRQLAQIVTNSYGFPTRAAAARLHQAVERHVHPGGGRGHRRLLLVGRQRRRDATLRLRDTDWPASSPWVTAVGGTSLGVSADEHARPRDRLGHESYSCNTTTLACTRAGWLYGSGGGVSRIFPKPAYQSGLSVSRSGVPDVAALGDPQTGLLIGQTQTFPDGASYDEYRIGGTSSRARSSPASWRWPTRRRDIRTGSRTRSSMRTRPLQRRAVGQDGRRAAELQQQCGRERGDVGLPPHVRRLLRLADPAHGRRLGQRDRPRVAERRVLALANVGRLPSNEGAPWGALVFGAL